MELDQAGIQESRQAVMDETGDMPPCPFCQRARAQRSDYLRCCRCGINWLDSEMHFRDYLNRNPAAARSEAARTVVSVKRHAESGAGDANGEL